MSGLTAAVYPRLGGWVLAGRSRVSTIRTHEHRSEKLCVLKECDGRGFLRHVSPSWHKQSDVTIPN